MGKRTTHLSFLAAALLLLATGYNGYARSRASGDPATLLHNSAQQQGLFFVENKGQIRDQDGHTRKDISYRMNAGKGIHIFIGNTGLHYQWSQAKTKDGVLSLHRMDVTLLNANSQAQAYSEEPLPYREQYYTGEAGNTAIKAGACRKIRYKEVYPGIDWLLYVDDKGRLEYDFIVHPGGRVADIRLKFEGMNTLQINPDGSLKAATDMGSITEHAPQSFEAGGRKVTSRFTLNNNILGFETDPYQGTLTIDPVLEWATYYGGTAEDQAASVTTDELYNVYMTGYTRSATNIATTGAFNTTLTPQIDAFIVKLDSAGNRLWGTYYGGNGSDFARQIASDRNGSIYIGGYTQSTGLATTGAHQSTLAGSMDAFLARFDVNGNRVWHTYYGGTSDDLGQSVTCDPSGNIYLTGYTNSTTGIASTGAYRTTFAGVQDAFLVKFSNTGTRLWGTYFGGIYTEYGNSVACDPGGNVYMCGRTSSLFDIASPGAYQTTYLGTVMFGFNFGYVGFLTRFDGAGNYKWGTYYSAATSEATAVACDPFYNIYMAGRTMKDTIYVASPGAHQGTMGSYGDLYGDAFLAKFDSAGVRRWGTYFGGSKEEDYVSVTSNMAGDAYLSGRTSSPNNIASTNGYLTQLNDSCTPAGCLTDAFLARFDSSGTRLWGTYYGTKASDNFYDVASDGYGSVYACGFSNSETAIATAGSHQDIIGGGLDGILVKFYDCQAPPAAPAPITGSDTVCSNSTATYSVPPLPGITNNWTLPTGWNSSSLTGDAITAQASALPGAGTIKVKASAKCENRTLTDAEASFPVYIPLFNEAVITVNVFVLGTTLPYTTYQWFRNGTALPGATASTYTVTENADYTVAVTDAYGCTDTSDIYTVSNVTAIDGPDRIPAQIAVYPNPAKDHVWIKSPVPVSATLSGIEGRVLIREDKAGLLSLSGLAPGIYLLQISDRTGRILKTDKIVKQ